jgi:hypothetical protein
MWNKPPFAAVLFEREGSPRLRDVLQELAREIDG